MTRRARRLPTWLWLAVGLLLLFVAYSLVLSAAFYGSACHEEPHCLQLIRRWFIEGLAAFVLAVVALVVAVWKHLASRR